MPSADHGSRSDGPRIRPCFDPAAKVLAPKHDSSPYAWPTVSHHNTKLGPFAGVWPERARGHKAFAAADLVWTLRRAGRGPEPTPTIHPPMGRSTPVGKTTAPWGDDGVPTSRKLRPPGCEPGPLAPEATDPGFDLASTPRPRF